MTTATPVGRMPLAPVLPPPSDPVEVFFRDLRNACETLVTSGGKQWQVPLTDWQKRAQRMGLGDILCADPSQQPRCETGWALLKRWANSECLSLSVVTSPCEPVGLLVLQEKS